jgi:hypothetical protein
MSTNNAKQRAKAQKPAGSNAESRNNGIIRISPRTIDSLENIDLDQVIQQYLLNAKAEISIRIGANSVASVELLQKGSNEVVGNISDLKKIGAFRGFVIEQKKESTVAESLEPTVSRFIQASAIMRDENEGMKNFLPKALKSEALAQDRAYAKTLETVSHNKELFSSLAKGAQKATAVRLAYWCAVILDLTAELEIALVASSPKEKGWLKKQLLVNGVPYWFSEKIGKSKLTDKSADWDVRRYLFPEDGKKGLSFSLKEVRYPEFCSKNSDVIGDFEWIRQLLADDGFVACLCRTGTKSLADETDKEIEALLRTKVLIPNPHFSDLEFFMVPKTRAKFGTMSLRAAYTTPAKALETFSDAVYSVSDFSIIGHDVYTSFWTPVLKNLPEALTEIKGASRSANIFDILLRQDKGMLRMCLQMFRGGETPLQRKTFEAALMSLMNIEVGPLSTRLSAAIGRVNDVPSKDLLWPNEAKKDESGFVALTNLAKKCVGTETELPDLAKTYALLAPVDIKLTGRDLPVSVRESLQLEKLRKTKKVREDRVAHSKLGKEGTRVLRQILNDDKTKFLYNGLNEWFRSFSSVASQDAAALIVEAQFDKITSYGDEPDGDVTENLEEDLPDMI